MQLKLIADADSPAVSKYAGAGNGTNPYGSLLDEVHQEHPAVSPWYAIPGIDDINFDEDATDDHKAEVIQKETKKALMLMRRHAKTLGPTGRRILTGKHTSTGQTVWAMGGPLPAGKATSSKTAKVTELPTQAEKAVSKSRGSTR